MGSDNGKEQFTRTTIQHASDLGMLDGKLNQYISTSDNYFEQLFESRNSHELLLQELVKNTSAINEVIKPIKDIAGAVRITKWAATITAALLSLAAFIIYVLDGIKTYVSG